jgi:hypothetical protein
MVQDGTEIGEPSLERLDALLRGGESTFLLLLCLGCDARQGQGQGERDN